MAIVSSSPGLVPALARPCAESWDAKDTPQFQGLPGWSERTHQERAPSALTKAGLGSVGSRPANSAREGQGKISTREGFSESQELAWREGEEHTRCWE